MSGYYWNKINTTDYSRSYDRDYAVISKVEEWNLVVTIIYNSDIKLSDVVLKRDLTKSEAKEYIKKINLKV